MNIAFADARYADELERVLYNGVLAAVSHKGDTYFYQNPLETGPGRTRWSWHPCPCCPPMFLKIMGALPSYIYAHDKDSIYINLFIGSQAQITLDGSIVMLKQSTRYPWEGEVKITVEPEKPAVFSLNVRVPSWCRFSSSPGELYTWADESATNAAELKVNGSLVEKPNMVRGYVLLRRLWKRGDIVELLIPLPALRVKAHPKVEADTGRVALMCGPIVYCLESVDNHDRVRELALPPEAKIFAEYRADLLGGVTVIRGVTPRSYKTAPHARPCEFVAIPYYANAHRGGFEMTVWVPEKPGTAMPSTIASEAIPSASYSSPTDRLDALNDQIEPRHSADTSVPYFSWWGHRGSQEWVQYDFSKTATKLRLNL